MIGMTQKPQVAVVGIGSTAIVRTSDRSLGSFAVEAVRNAVLDAGLAMGDIDGYVGSPGAPNASALNLDGLDEVSQPFMVNALGLDARWAMDVTGMPTAMVVAAAQALAAGTCNYVVGLRAHYNPKDRKYSQSTAALAGGPDQFTLPYGYGPGGTRFALWLQRYMHDHGAKRESLFAIAASARSHARRNPLAIWRDAGELTLDAYLGSRWLHEPMCLFDADMPATAAAAFVMTTAERARDLQNKPAYLVSYANAHQPRRVFENVGIQPSGIQVAQIYDGYSVLVWNVLEQLGFCGTGEAHQFATQERLSLTGALPMNTFGGALGEGRLHGMGHVREAVLQVMGRAGERQISDVRFSLAHVGVPERYWTLLFSPDPL